MTRQEIEEFIKRAMSGNEQNSDPVKAIADRWEEDVSAAREDGIADGRYAGYADGFSMGVGS